MTVPLSIIFVACDYAMKFKISFLIFLTSLILLTSQAQDWKSGLLQLNEDTVVAGQFVIQHFANLSAVRHLKPDGTQNTYNINQVQWIKLIQDDGDTLHLKTLDFDMPNAENEPKVLMQELYTSQNLKLIKGNVLAVRRFFYVYPIPIAGLWLLFKWGKHVQDEECVLLMDGSMESLTLVSKLESDEGYTPALLIDQKLILDKFMPDHKKEMKSFVKENRLDWDDLSDLARIIAYFDKIKNQHD